MPRRPGYLLRAWRRAPPFERAMVMLAADCELAQMALQKDLGWFMGRGKRPQRPSRIAPSTLVELVHKHGLRLTEVAAKIGVSDRTVQRWWHGRACPKARHVHALAALANSVTEKLARMA